MKTVAFQLILLSLASMCTFGTGSLLCDVEIFNTPLGCMGACGGFEYDCLSNGTCVCTGFLNVLGIKVAVQCNDDDSIVCNLACVNLNDLHLGTISSYKCIEGICKCFYNL